MSYKAECSSLKQFQVSCHSNEWNLEAFTSKLLTYKVRNKKEATGLPQHERTKHQDTRLTGDLLSILCQSLMPADAKDTSFHFLFTFRDLGTHLYPYSMIHTGMAVKLQKATIQANSFDTICFFPEMQEGWKSSRGPWTDAAAVPVWPHRALSLQSQYQADSRGDKGSNTTVVLTW